MWRSFIIWKSQHSTHYYEIKSRNLWQMHANVVSRPTASGNMHNGVQTIYDIALDFENTKWWLNLAGYFHFCHKKMQEITVFKLFWLTDSDFVHIPLKIGQKRKYLLRFSHLWSSGFLRRPRKFDRTYLICFYLVNVKSTGRFRQLFGGLLKKPEL